MVNLTEQELDFLIELQHEMLTQDPVSQAAPRFWVVAQEERVSVAPGYEDGVELIGPENDKIADTLEEAVKYFIEYIDENFNSKLSCSYEYQLLKDEQYSTPHYTRYALFRKDRQDKEAEADIHDFISDFEELLDALDDFHIIDKDDYNIFTYRNEHTIKKDTLFLTNRGCKRHIERNHYHYNDTVHSYAMTAWRSPEVEQLWNILDKINWKELKEERYGAKKEENESNG